MATIRHHARLAASPDEVWAVVRVPDGLADWLPGVEAVQMDGDDTRLVTAMGADIREQIVTVDDELRRFQYAITESPLGTTSHLATIDIIAEGDGCLAVYSCDVHPGEAKPIIDMVAAGTIAGLQSRFGG